LKQIKFLFKNLPILSMIKLMLTLLIIIFFVNDTFFVTFTAKEPNL